MREARDNTLVVRIDDVFHVAGPRTPNDWRLFSALSRATFSSADELARSGFDVVVDTVFERSECLEMARELIDAPRLVAVTCPLEVIEARELARGDRRPGQARDQLARVFHGADYALTLDTSVVPVDECVARVCEIFAR